MRQSNRAASTACSDAGTKIMLGAQHRHEARSGADDARFDTGTRCWPQHRIRAHVTCRTENTAAWLLWHRNLAGDSAADLEADHATPPEHPFERGIGTLADLREIAAAAGEPQQCGGRQEVYENIREKCLLRSS
jgi:hypothetical protein